MLHSDLKKTEYVAWRSFLDVAEKWSSEEISRWQRLALSSVLERSGRLPGYAKLHGDTSNLGVDDLHLLPFLDRRTLQESLNDFSFRSADSEYVTTGGSTGIPLGLYRTPEVFYRELASKAHQYSRVGWCEGERQVVLRGTVIDDGNHTKFIPYRNELLLSSYHLDDDSMEFYLGCIRDFDPLWIKCYPSSGYIFAKWLKDQGQSIRLQGGVLCASENLYDYQKEMMQDVFRCRVFSHYGHYECAALAGYCEHTDYYHVLPFYGYVELIDKDGKQVTEPGQQGEIVATSFIMSDTPLVRYRTGDIATLRSFGCPKCKRPYMILDSIDGRIQEMVMGFSGKTISMTSINFHDNTFDGVQQFQFYQDEPGVLYLNYISYNDGSIDTTRIRVNLIAKLGNDFRLVLRKVNEIPLTNRGKHRFLIQKLDIRFGE